MIVRCIHSILPSDDPACLYWTPDLTRGKTYRVICVEDDQYRLLGDEGRPFSYPQDAFEIVESTIDSNWITQACEDNYFCGPRELHVTGIFEDYFDGDEKARIIVDKCIAKQFGVPSE